MSFHELSNSIQYGSTFRVDPARLFELVEKLHQFMFIKDLSGRFIYGNANFIELMASTPAALYEKRDGDFFPQELCAHFRAVDDGVQLTGNEWSGQEEIQFPNGDKKVVWCNKTPLRDDNGSISGVVGIFADVTRNYEAHAELITERTNDLVHEILIPMDSIASILESLLGHENAEYSLEKTDRVDRLRLAQSELHILGMHAENMQRTLVGDNEGDMVFRNASIKTVLNNCRNALSAAARIKNVDFRSIKLKDMRYFPDVEMFEPDMTRAFKNIYHNALKYSYSGKSPHSPYPSRWIETVVGSASTGEFYVEIENYGVGITPEELPRIFDVGKRGKYSIDRQRTGSGIGLSQVKRIVERHGGNVSARSERLGGPWRTTLRVVLPYEQSDEALRYEDNLEDSLG